MTLSQLLRPDSESEGLELEECQDGGLRVRVGLTLTKSLTRSLRIHVTAPAPGHGPGRRNLRLFA